jgi:2-C-methyl-D-erythritol 4-phosphate cytidylyltransferase
MKVVAIIPAAGLGTRMGKPSAESAGTSRKQFMLLEGAPILVHTIRKFSANPKIAEIIVAIRPEDRAEFEANLAGERFAKPVRFADGGRSRQESVAHALADAPRDTDLVAVHDAVRPFVTIAQIDEAIAQASETGAAILGIPAICEAGECASSTPVWCRGRR